jgi:NAD(P)H-dependent FMN reductase
MKIIAFGASASKNSINKQFATYVAGLFDAQATEILDLNNYQLPLFSVDTEKKSGIPEDAKMFHQKLREADLIIISMAEHNGSYTAYFKNLFDWVSRHDLKMFSEKKLLLLSTAPGARGGLSALEAARDRFPRHGGEIAGSFSLPHFTDNFSTEKGILDEKLNADLIELVQQINAGFKSI